MDAAIAEWLEGTRAKLAAGNLAEAALEGILQRSRQQILDLCVKPPNMRAPISSWARFDPSAPHEPTLPDQEPPYPSVLEAMDTGWRVAQCPIAKLYRFSNSDDDDLGFELALEKQAGEP